MFYQSFVYLVQFLTFTKFDTHLILYMDIHIFFQILLEIYTPSPKYILDPYFLTKCICILIKVTICLIKYHTKFSIFYR